VDPIPSATLLRTVALYLWRSLDDNQPSTKYNQRIGLSQSPFTLRSLVQPAKPGSGNFSAETLVKSTKETLKKRTSLIEKPPKMPFNFIVPPSPPPSGTKRNDFVPKWNDPPFHPFTAWSINNQPSPINHQPTSGSSQPTTNMQRSCSMTINSQPSTINSA